MQSSTATPGVPGGEHLYKEWAAPPPINSSSFAGLLAALTSPAANSSSKWNDDDVGDDVATLSYERALRAHARYKSAESGDWALTEPTSPEVCQTCGAHKSDRVCSAQTAGPEGNEDADPKPARVPSPMMFEGNKKSASITIRMSKAECNQLKKRAAEARLTISAYLRSCTFEAEALRAEVKQALAELRLAKTPQAAPSPVKPRVRLKLSRPWFDRLLQFLSHWHSGQRIARA
jgi:hypothetical protein